MTLLFHSDPSHGWLEVPIQMIDELGVKVSTYSYRHGTDAFLEEDIDAPNFIRAAVDAGYEFTILDRKTNRDSIIRRYDSYYELALEWAAEDLRCGVYDYEYYEWEEVMTYTVEVTAVETIYGRQPVATLLTFEKEPTYEDVVAVLSETYDEIRSVDYEVL